MPKNPYDSVCKLKGSSVTISVIKAGRVAGTAPVQLVFSEGTELLASYWRLVRNRKEVVSSFDHHKKYGLAAAVDAIKELQNELQHKTVSEAHIDEETGDLLFQFAEDIKLQIFAFSGHEVWEIRFPDGTGEYSNFAR